MRTPSLERVVPVTVVAGRPGAGKSGVVGRLLTTLAPRAAVICDGFEHDHGSVRTVHTEQDLLHATQGCACCAVRADLAEAIGDLLDRRRPATHIVIEASGGSDLATIAQTFFRDPLLRQRTSLAGLVTIVDGLAAGTSINTRGTLGLEGPDLDAVAMSDLVVVNRFHRLLPDLEERTAWSLWALASAGQIQIDPPAPDRDELPERILDLPGFDLRRQAERLQPGPLDTFTDEGRPDHPSSPLRRIRLQVAGELDRRRLDDWLGRLQDEGGVDLLRWRARFAVAGEARDWLVQGVRTSVLVDDGPLRAVDPHSLVEVIARAASVDGIRQGLAACAA